MIPCRSLELPDNMVRRIRDLTCEDYKRCFQLMECDDVQLFQEWTNRWNDLVDFEIVAIQKSEDAALRVTSIDIA